MKCAALCSPSPGTDESDSTTRSPAHRPPAAILSATYVLSHESSRDMNGLPATATNSAAAPLALLCALTGSDLVRVPRLHLRGCGLAVGLPVRSHCFSLPLQQRRLRTGLKPTRTLLVHFCARCHTIHRLHHGQSFDAALLWESGLPGTAAGEGGQWQRCHLPLPRSRQTFEPRWLALPCRQGGTLDGSHHSYRGTNCRIGGWPSLRGQAAGSLRWPWRNAVSNGACQCVQLRDWLVVYLCEPAEERGYPHPPLLPS